MKSTDHYPVVCPTCAGKGTISKAFPEFVTLHGTAVAVRLIEIKKKKAKYYRDAGCWDVWIERKGNDLICSDNIGSMAHVNGTIAKACTVADFKKDNRGYLPLFMK